MIDTEKYRLLLEKGDLKKTISGLIHDFNLHLTNDSSAAVEEMYNTVTQLSFRFSTLKNSSTKEQFHLMYFPLNEIS